MNQRPSVQRSVLPQRLSRRTALRGAAATVSLPFLDAMHGTVSAQSTGAAPKRIIFYYTGNGFPPRHWRCDVDREVTPIADVQLSHILSPLEPVKQHCTFIEGVPMNSGLKPPRYATAHAGGTGALLTGSQAKQGNQYGGGGAAGVNGAGFPGVPSLDHLIAQAVGAATRFPAYYTGVQVAGPKLLKSVFYGGDGSPVTPSSDPYAVRDQLFSGEFQQRNQGDPEGAQRRLADQTVVLDSVMESARAMRCKLGAADRARLDLHLTQVREIEASLAAPVNTSGACEVLEPPLGLRPNQVPQFEQLAPTHLDLLSMALTCDLTRVSGFFFTPALHNPTYTWLGQSEGHHNMTHNSSMYDACADVSRWHAEQVLYLTQKLANTPEGDGSVLDNTVILWATECAQTYRGNPHDLVNVGFTLIGGGGGHFKTGQYLKFPGGDAFSHNRLLISLAQYMGLETEVIGDREFCAGGALPYLTV